MILQTVYIRFYRAFNFDYLRAQHANANPDPWDVMDDETFYPYVTLDVDPEMTSIVGANESGKSQLLDAVECALGSRTFTPADFCRYSTFFTVSQDMRTPHFGLKFGDFTESESGSLRQLFTTDDESPLSDLRVFRVGHETAVVFVNDGQSKYELDASGLASLQELLPTPTRIDSSLGIPNSVPIAYLTDRHSPARGLHRIRRADRLRLIDSLFDRAHSDSQELESIATDVASQVRGVLQTQTVGGEYEKEMALAFDLLVTVSDIQPSAFAELHKALREDNEGMANGIVDSMNRQIEEHMNLAKWWSQDKRFQLALAVRDFDIVFTIRDRTGSQYSFAERSEGLRYFLSYLVQFLACMKTRSGPEILLMDEPDAYLSNQGQQDLLRILQEYAAPSDSAPAQVLYVTHSPFLIDKNRADRIRVLDKGSIAEGTRVVHDVSRNYFEPIRTALGGFVGETVFIGNCNLILEGSADQIYLAGMSTLLHREGRVANTEYLDLNRITLVPAGGASEVPYRTFLALGRGADKPAVIVLLDGDDEGSRALAILMKFGPKKRRLIRQQYVTQLRTENLGTPASDRPGGVLVTEDLIPVELALAAVESYMKEIGYDVDTELPTAEQVRSSLSQERGILDALQAELKTSGISLSLAKVSFARHVVRCCEADVGEHGQEMRQRFAILFKLLGRMQREAERERQRESIKGRIHREISRFRRDYERRSPTRADVAVLLEAIGAVLDESSEGENLRRAMRQMVEELQLDRDQSELVADLKDLYIRLDKLKYAELLAAQPGSE